MKEDKAIRYNKDKLKYTLMHPLATEGMVRVLTKGLDKYPEHNWEKGFKWSVVLDSLKRHLQEVEKGNDYDEETGELHIDHLQCNAHFLSAFYHIYPEGDDRRKNIKEFKHDKDK